MGGTTSTRRVTFEADENENITVVKGIRLSENVIDRMKESSPSGSKSPRYSGAYGASVSDEELKRRVAEELALEQAKKESEDQKRLKQAKELDRERAAANEQLTRAILRERISSEEERAKAKHLARQLEEKDRVLKKQDAFYKEQLARLEERVSRPPTEDNLFHMIKAGKAWLSEGFSTVDSPPRWQQLGMAEKVQVTLLELHCSSFAWSSEFYKVTTEQYQKAAEEVEAKFNRFGEMKYHKKDSLYFVTSCPSMAPSRRTRYFSLISGNLSTSETVTGICRYLKVIFQVLSYRRWCDHHVGQRRFSTFPSLQKVLLDGTVLENAGMQARTISGEKIPLEGKGGGRRYESHPVCADLQAKILQCYRENTHQTLKCSSLATQYMHCVNHAKQSMLEKGG
ncbi:PREDICTED: MICOS complex subunit MIC19 isoform X2 [Rhinopithecus bieti]|uniref:MICOS complex subunit MIC19 isoform X2 n=1 Tax=Rhinopithecus bieti TaxID=61621 RepID=UPI00083C79ED|nr:PREDICTED: MICOS complex subunit MIC19 isoform X2 [Rhinopithecus bieti]